MPYQPSCFTLQIFVSTLLHVSFLGSYMARAVLGYKETGQCLRSMCGHRKTMVFVQWPLSWGSTSAAEVGMASKAVAQLQCGILKLWCFSSLLCVCVCVFFFV